MDEGQRWYYQMCLGNAVRDKKGSAFQDWFVELAGHAFGPDFEAVRSYGSQGDFKCDGRRISTGTIFQCYAPDRMNANKLNRKIGQDFHGAHAHWKDSMAEWVLIHNDKRGLPPSSSKLLDQLRQNYPDISIKVWTEPKLRELAADLPLYAQEALFGYAPSKIKLEGLMLADIKPIIDELQRSDTLAGQEPLTPPSVDKLARNSLSKDAAGLLRLGRRKEALVETWFNKSPNADLGERIAEAFRRRYAQLKQSEMLPDQIFMQLQHYAGMGGEPKQQSAALAVLSYFFERCDIFEDPERGE